MRVLCINGSNVGYIGKMSLTGTKWVATSKDIVIEGEIYTVTGTWPYEGKLFYELAERPPECVYLSTRFIPLSDIEETELVNNKEEVYA